MNSSELRHVKLFEQLPESELRDIASRARDVRYEAGTPVVVRGEDGIGFSIILEGEAEVRTADGRARTLRAGDYFGEMSLLDHEGRSATVTAVTGLHCAAIPEWSFETFLSEHPKISFRLLQTLSRRLREAEIH